MTKQTDTADPKLLPATEMIDRELVELALESHARALMYPNSRVQHDRANECRAEILRRLTRTGSPSAVWDQAIKAARKRKDEFVDNPDGGTGKFDEAQIALWGMFEIITRLEEAKRASTPATATDFVRGYEQAREDAAKVCRSKADSLRLGAEDGIAPAYAEDIELCELLAVRIASLAPPPPTRADANADFRAEWKACDAELFKKDQRTANFWFLTGRYGTADELSASREPVAEMIHAAEDQFLETAPAHLDEGSYKAGFWDAKTRIIAALKATSGNQEDGQ